MGWDAGQFNASVKPRYQPRGGKIIPLDLELCRHSIFGCLITPVTAASRGVRCMIDPLEAFNPARFQWAKHEFIDPMELKAVYKGKSPAQLFGGFSIEGR